MNDKEAYCNKCNEIPQDFIQFECLHNFCLLCIAMKIMEDKDLEIIDD